ncbi:MAG: hypothetical protein DRP64_16035 [Verrucomicrobia bacterium]|nr:MAG: hypothetical protein DRP64_16035 [Verrucomicrobiota bacterium]
MNNDSRTDPAWADVYRSFDVLSPWSVGRFSDQSGADSWKNNAIVPDVADTQGVGVDYCPVIWPGFSWHNLTGNSINQIPRNGGNFYWRQAYNAVSAGATNMIYVAMFDEVDEATAIYKVAPTASDVPDQGYWLTLDADGYSLPSDWYLRLTFEIGDMLRSNAPVSAIPTDPGPHYTERGTPLAWLDSFGLIEKDGFENADTSDTDSDTMPAWEEYIAGTIPTNSLSLFRITGMATDPSHAVIIWPAIADRLYSIYLSTNLLDGVTNHSGFIDVDGVPGLMSYTNAFDGAQSEFYRLGVRLKP